MGQLVIRSSQNRMYPSRVVMMSRRFNPQGFHDEVMQFLHADTASLDEGVSLPLQGDA